MFINKRLECNEGKKKTLTMLLKQSQPLNKFKRIIK